MLVLLLGLGFLYVIQTTNQEQTEEIIETVEEEIEVIEVEKQEDNKNQVQSNSMSNPKAIIETKSVSYTHLTLPTILLV